MNSNSYLLFIILFFAPQFLKAQEYEMNKFSYDSAPGRIQLSSYEENEPAVIINDKIVAEFFPDANYSIVEYYSHYRKVYIADHSQIEKFNRIYFPIDNPDNLRVFKARTISKSGRIIEFQKSDMKMVKEEGENCFILALDGISAGSVVEYFYTVRQKTIGDISETIQSSVFIRHYEMKVISPVNLVFEMKSYNGKVNHSDTSYNMKRYLNINCDSIVSRDEGEKFASTKANLLRMEFKPAYYSDRPLHKLLTWQDAGRGYFYYFHDHEKSSQNDIIKLCDSLHLKNCNQEIQARRLENYLKRKITVVERADDENETVSEVLNNSFGSQKVLTSIYLLAFAYLKIPYQLIITSSRLEKRFDTSFESVSFLEKELIYFPGISKYLDPSDGDHRLGLIPYEYAANRCLTVVRVNNIDYADGLTSIDSIEPAPIDSSYDNIYADVDFATNIDKVNIHFKRTYSGYCGEKLRADIFNSNEGNREAVIMEMITKTINNVKISNDHISNFDLTGKEVNEHMVVEADLVSTSLIERAGATKLFAVGKVIGPQVEMYSEHKRQNPIDVAYLHSHNHEINIKIPDGYSVKGLEKLDFHVNLYDGGYPYMGFVSSYKIENNSIKIKVREYYDKLILPVSDYENFKKVINAAADFNKIKLILVKN